MAKKKTKTAKKTTSKAAPRKKAKGVATGKKVGKKVVKSAKTLLGKLAQRSAQLILETGLLGEVSKPSKKSTKKRARKV